jgi:microcystin-dependent protein
LPVGVGASVTVGQRGGEITHTLQSSEMPVHSHLVTTDLETATSRTPPGRQVILAQSGGGPVYGTAGSMTTMNPSAISLSGGSRPHENRMPYLVLTFCIALTGLVPPRN